MALTRGRVPSTRERWRKVVEAIPKPPVSLASASKGDRDPQAGTRDREHETPPGAVEYDARMAALADDVELGWPHRCAERYVSILLGFLEAPPVGVDRRVLMDRIERVLGLHPT